MVGALLARLDARDRALFVRYAAPRATRGRGPRLWISLTHLGGVRCTTACAALPIFVGGPLGHAARYALTVLVVSHLVVQLIKRTVGRPRPSCALACATLIVEPDKFSFPSGHSAAAMSVAFAYALFFPAIAAPLLVLAVLVGFSRVTLGVHYPGDVLMGQLIAVLTGSVVLAWSA